MKRKIETILLILVITALTAYLVVQKTGKTHYRLPEIPRLDKGEINRITIRKGASEITLQRDGDRWRILPQGYEADAAAVGSMLDTLAGLRLTAMASASKSYAMYGLQEGERVQVTASKGDEPLLRLGIGKAAPSHRHTFVELADDPRVYHAEKNFRGLFDKDVSALREKQVLKIDEEVSEIILTPSGGKSLHLLRTTAPEENLPSQEPGAAVEEAVPPPSQHWQTSDGGKVKEKEVDGLLKMLSNLKCEGYAEEKKESLGNPTFSVSLKGSRAYELTLYGEKEGKVVATSSENEDPFLLSDWKAKRIEKDPADLIEKKD